MKILAISTTSINSFVALNNEGEVSIINIVDKQSEKLLSTIDEILNKANISLKDIDCFAVNVGPGSFTGIRIGIATIKAFLFSQNKSCVILNSFELIAYNIKDNNFIVIVDSGNKDFYYAHYINNKIVSLSNADENSIIKYAKDLNIPIYASYLDADKISNSSINIVEFDKEIILKIAETKYKNKEFAQRSELCPIYIKKSQAENSLNENISKNLIITFCTNYKDLLPIENECFEFPWTEKIMQEEFENNDRFYYIAKVKDEIVGYIGIWNTGDDLNILKIAVIPRFRNLSIGQKLIETAVNLRNEKGFKQLFLEVDDKNEKAINLYKKCGFEVASIRKRYYQNGDDCLVMFFK